MVRDSVQNGLRHQARACIIQVYAVGATGSVFAPLAHIVSHAFHRSRTAEALSDWRVAWAARNSQRAGCAPSGWSLINMWPARGLIITLQPRIPSPIRPALSAGTIRARSP